jgi:cytochrome d ubiquinol oxidase subunit II
MMPTLSLVPVWTVILAIGVFFYVALDGFDLGVGMLYNFAPERRARDLVMNSIAPIWDGNETWLILGSVGLLAAFPVAFAIIIPAVYFPILLMLLALIFRGLAFEFRYRQAEHRTFWDHGFAYGSALAAFSQGVILGSFIQGFHVEGRHFAGSSFDCFTPFSIFTGLALMSGYALLGAGWLVIKMEGTLQDWARSLGRRCLIGTTLAVAVVSLWTPFIDAHIATRWFSWPNIALLAPVPLITVGLIWYVWWSLNNNRSDYAPFFGALGLFMMSYLGIAISLWPMIVPRHFTLEQAAASPSTQAFLLVGTLVLLPVILLYTGWSYWVFHGKVRADIGYH